MKTENELVNEFKSCNNDTDRWKWVIKNKKNKDISIMMDNCGSGCVKMYKNKNKEIIIGAFDESYNIEDSDAISSLLNAIGINWEYFEFRK